MTPRVLFALSLTALLLVPALLLDPAPAAGEDELPPLGAAPAPEGPAHPVQQAPLRKMHVLKLSLRKAVQMGVRGNLSLLESSYNTPIAWQGRVAADASFDRLLTAGFTVAHNETPSTNMFLGSGVTVDNNINAQVGLTRRLRTGGSISLLYRADRVSTNNPFATVNPGYTGSLSGEISYPLLRGAGDTALADIRRAQNNVAAARATHRGEVEAVLLQIAEAYWELVYADANLAARRKAEEVARELLDDATARMDAEVGTPLDVAEAQAGVERRVSEVLGAENLRETLEDRLLSLIVPFGPSVRHAIRIEPTDSTSAAPDTLPKRSEEQRYVKLALQGRPELQASKAAIAVLGIDTLVARDAIKPQLDVIGRVGTDGLDAGLGGSIEDVITGRAASAAVGLEFSMFIGRRAARAQWLTAAWRRRQALLKYRELQNQIVVQVRAALRDLSTARGQLTAGRAEVAAADEGLQGERLKLDQGKSTPFRVLQKEDDRTAARTRAARASADLSIAEARLARAVGTMAASMGVDASHWKPCPDCR